MGTAAQIALFLGLIAAGVLLVVIVQTLSEYVFPSPSHARFAALVNVPRRHLESLSDWSKRCAEAHSRRRVSEDAFIKEASYQDTGPRSGQYVLPRNHPAAIALLAAKYPDGPPLEELLAIAGHEGAP